MNRADAQDATAAPQAGDRWRDCAGFTLVETLVAMTVLTLFAAILLRGVVALRADAAWFGDRSQVGLVAETVMEDALRNRKLGAGMYHGEQDGRRWTLVASSVDLKAQLPAANTDAKSGQTAVADALDPTRWAPQRLRVLVEASGRSVEIETIRLAAAK